MVQNINLRFFWSYVSPCLGICELAELAELLFGLCLAPVASVPRDPPLTPASADVPEESSRSAARLLRGRFFRSRMHHVAGWASYNGAYQASYVCNHCTKAGLRTYPLHSRTRSRCARRLRCILP